MNLKKIQNVYNNKIKPYNSLIIIIITPIIASIIPIVSRTKAARCAFVIIVMATYWLTKVLPLGVTSLFPIVLFPLLGILPSDKVTRAYFKDIVMLFIGGVIVANVIEQTRLHERVALNVVIRFGSNPKWLMLGFMIITAFVSLWITNTAATIMMLPIIDAVVQQIVKNDPDFLSTPSRNDVPRPSIIRLSQSAQTIAMSLDDLRMSKENNITNTNSEILKSEPRIEVVVQSNDTKTEPARRLAVGFLMASAFSATIGGLGSLVGSTPNILIKGYFDKNYPQMKLDFVSYLLFAFPITVIMILFSWLWLVFQWLPRKYIFSWRKTKTSGLSAVDVVLREKYASLGRLTWGQKCVGIGFLILICLWITRDLHGLSGWGKLFEKGFVTDSTPAMLISLLLFICPKENIFAGHPYESLICWDKMLKQLPWDVVFLIGGGLVMADGFQESGLSNTIADQLKYLASDDSRITLLIVLIVSAAATQFTSNLSMASVLLPIVDTFAKNLNVNPTYFLLPMILAVSLAFILPIANPNNAIVFSTGQIRMMDMVSSGSLINILGVLVVYMASNLWLGSIFDIKTVNIQNSTIPFNFTDFDS